MVGALLTDENGIDDGKLLDSLAAKGIVSEAEASDFLAAVEAAQK